MKNQHTVSKTLLAPAMQFVKTRRLTTLAAHRSIQYVLHESECNSIELNFVQKCMCTVFFSSILKIS